MKALLDSRPLFEIEVGREAPRWRMAWPAALGAHALAAAVVVVGPILAEEPLPEQGARATQAFFAGPMMAPAPPPPPPPPAAAARPVAARVAPATAAAFTAPVEVPQDIVPEAGLDLGLEGGVPGGVEGGVPGGVVGGVVGGLEELAPPPPQVVRVGGTIREPRKVKDVAPVYPAIALRAGLQGVVILEATISPQGRVQDVKVLRSVPTLDEPAIEAVRQWVYTPTLVNGMPVGVILTVTVNFQLREARR
jgi:protein TonB